MLLTSSVRFLVAIAAFIVLVNHRTSAEVHRYKFVIARTQITKLCKTYSVVTVNGQLPGPTLYVNNGDTLIVKVFNKAQYNASIHWHGVRQLGTGWSDGAGYITQCPIQPGGSFTHRFTIIAQEGTLFYHAHVSWLRATVHGALVIYPKQGSSYPFPQPHGEIPIVLGQWWNTDPMVVVTQATLTGSAPNISDGFTINGQPGDLYPCSRPGTFKIPVQKGNTYLLRVVNAAVNNQLFLKIAGHSFTVVGVDAGYTKPYTTDVLFISPGQTTDVLFTANQQPGSYYMAARVYTSQAAGAFDNTTTTAIVQYLGSSSSASPKLPQLPAYNDTASVFKFTRGLRSLNSREHPVDVPKTLDKIMFTTIGLGLIPCASGTTCGGPNNSRIAGSMNNISFVEPKIALLQAYYFGINGIYTTDFPAAPPVPFNYTGDNIPQSLKVPSLGTKVKVLYHNATVQMVFQGTNIFVADNHPMHLHGHDVFVVGEGSGIYNPGTDPATFNLVDPPQRNTVGVPVNGWAAIRFRADNPGVWFMHCHFDDHMTWGLNMAWIVKNGLGKLATLPPPPQDLPSC